MNAKIKAANSGDDVKFDFAANRCNVSRTPAKSNKPLLLASKGPVHNEPEHEYSTTSAT